jgi:lipoate-protein ligase A
MHIAHCKIIETGALSAYENMAVDEFLLRECQRARAYPILRLYGWEPACFSFGYFQKPEHIFREYTAETAPCKVRRFTGGKTVFHYNDFSYTLVAPLGYFGAARGMRALYEEALGFLVRTYEKLGARAAFSGTRESRIMHDDTALCYSSIEPYDILIRNRKIGGACIRKSRDIVFIHGFIPFEIGLRDLRRYVQDHVIAGDTGAHLIALRDLCAITSAEFSHVVKASFKEHFSCEFSERKLSREEVAACSELALYKYSLAAWNKDRRAHHTIAAHAQETVLVR